jgi:hypothetical protein
MKLHVSSLQWQITCTGICILRADILIAVLLMIQLSLLKYYYWSESRQFQTFGRQYNSSQCQDLFIHWQHNIPEDLKLYWFCSIQIVSLPVSYFSDCEMRSPTVRVEHVLNIKINNIQWYLIFISFILFSFTFQSQSSWRRKL